MATRPHLVLDGAELAADAVGADRIVLYIGEDHGAAQRAVRRALGERRAARARTRRVDLVLAPGRYIAGEESAAVHAVERAMPDPRPRRRDRTSKASAAGRPWSRTSRAWRTPRSSRAGAIPGIARPAGRDARHRPRHGRRRRPETGSARSRSGSRSVSSPVAGVVARPGRASAAAGRLFRWLDPRRRGVGRAARAGRPPARGRRVRLRGRGVPAVDRLRRPDDRPDPRLHGRPERRPVRSVRVRPAGHRRRDPADRDAAAGGDDLERIERWSTPARRSRRVSSSRRRGGPAPECARDLRRRVPTTTSARGRARSMHAPGRAA